MPKLSPTEISKIKRAKISLLIATGGATSDINLLNLLKKMKKDIDDIRPIEILVCFTKKDLNQAWEPNKEEISKALGIPKEDILHTSAREGTNMDSLVDKLLTKTIKQIYSNSQAANLNFIDVLSHLINTNEIAGHVAAMGKSGEGKTWQIYYIQKGQAPQEGTIPTTHGFEGLIQEVITKHNLSPAHFLNAFKELNLEQNQIKNLMNEIKGSELIGKEILLGHLDFAGQRYDQNLIAFKAMYGSKQM